jgi:plastocyanin
MILVVLKSKTSWFLCMLMQFTALTHAADLSIKVVDTNGEALKDAIVYIESTTSTKPKEQLQQDIVQKGKKFNPLVTVIQTGSSINFPNQDRVKHHVYSFSPVKKFELKLYSGVPATPVVFDKAGTAVLGCNIHDNMLAYVYIVDTPFFAKTNEEGNATISDVPNSQLELKVWHYALQEEGHVVSQMVKPNEKHDITVKIDLQPDALVLSK